MSARAPLPHHLLHVQELGGAALRALTGDRSLHYRGMRLWRGVQRLPSFGPHLDPSVDEDEDLLSFRGAVDASAMRLLHSDPGPHSVLTPADARERWVFELLEQLRAESMVAQALPGVATNLRRRFERWSLAFHASGMTETDSGLLLYTILQVCRSRLTGQPVLAATEEVIESTRGALSTLLAPLVAALRRHRFDQLAYARPAAQIASIVARSLAQQDDGGQTPARRTMSFSLWFDFDPADRSALASVPKGDSRMPSETQRRDRVFTTAYDTEQQASSLVRPVQLEEYRARLDRASTRLAVNLPRFARELQAALSLPVRGGWDDGQEDGVLDGGRLAQLITSPTERRLFRHERIAPRADCAVAFLVDCSASMRERIEPVALFVDTCARAFELAGATCEALGFTTGAWNGGRAWRDWQRAGRPPNPGRLNERRHLVFKDAATPWTRGRRGIAALLKSDLFREGIDGEAVDWACERLLSADARRCILFVLSDGSPMDSATTLANDAHYLGDHLREVVLRRQAQGRVEVRGIGIGLDLGTWYCRTFPIDISRGLDRNVFMDLVRLLRPSRPRA